MSAAAPSDRPQRSSRALAAGATELRLDELHGGVPGPTVTLLGGVHGDEPEGVLAVRRALALLRAAPLRGTVRAIAVANPLAHAANQRESPQDGANLARVFPGDAGGGPTAAIARVLSDEVIAGSDLLLDLHSGGRRFAMPLLAGYGGGGDEVSQRAAAAARTLGLGLLWEHDALAPGRTVATARELGVPAVYTEASGGGEVRGDELDRLVAGLLRVLAAQQMIALDALPDTAERVLALRPPAAQQIVRGDDGDLDSALAVTVPGTAVTRVHAGDLVTAGDVLAQVFGDDGALGETLRAPRDGVAVMVRREARVAAGDVCAAIAARPVAL